jgi:hypothetical protein
MNKISTFRRRDHGSQASLSAGPFSTASLGQPPSPMRPERIGRRLCSARLASGEALL